MRLRISAFLPQILMLLFGFLLLVYIIPQQINDTSNSTVGPSTYPTALAVLIMIMSIISLLSSFLKNRHTDQSSVEEADQDQTQDDSVGKGYKRVIIAIAILIIWAILTPMIGFAVVTFLMTNILMYVVGNRSLVRMIITSFILTFLLYVVAKYVLKLGIPAGVLF